MDPACPCGLTQEQLLAPNLPLGAGGLCIAFRKDKSLNSDGSRALCGELLGDHPHAPSVVQQPPEKRQKLIHMYLPTNPDTNTYNFFKNLEPSMPATIEDLKRYLSTNNPPKLLLAWTTFPHSFGDFLRDHCTVVDDEHACHSLTTELESFAKCSCASQFNSEKEVNGLVQRALGPMMILLMRNSSRNSHSSVTGNKLPNFKVEFGPYNAPIMLGEDKTYSAYVKGTKDPVVDLESKAPWDDWERFYGRLPYFFGYTCLAGPNTVTLAVGVMHRISRRFVSLFEHNIFRPEDRPRFALDLLKLLPVVKAVSLDLQNISGSSWQIVKDTLYVKTKISTIIYHNVPMLRKQWQWNSAAQSYDFRQRLEKDFQAIHQISSTNEDLLLMKLVPTIHPEITLELSIEMANTLVGYFQPYGNRLAISQESQLVQIVLSLALALRALHAAGIVHNDIRWDNVMEYRGKYFLVDFDDAYLLTEDFPSCPALSHLSDSEHCAKSFEHHTYEVDCWALGRLLQTSTVAITEGTRRVAQEIVQECPNSIEVVIPKLETLLQNFV